MVIYYMQKRCKILIKNFEIVVELKHSKTAEIIWDNLPIKSRTNIWGKEVYFFIPVNVDLETESKDEIELGEIAFWPAGKAIAIGFGKTPASIKNEIKLAAKCNIWGNTKFNLAKLKNIMEGEKVLVEKLI